jgi:hypothetical protein
MGILLGGEWRRRGEFIMPMMKGTSSDYSSTRAARTGCGQDELGRECMRHGLELLAGPFIGSEEGAGGGGWRDVMANGGGIENL